MKPNWFQTFFPSPFTRSHEILCRAGPSLITELVSFPDLANPSLSLFWRTGVKLPQFTSQSFHHAAWKLVFHVVYVRTTIVITWQNKTCSSELHLKYICQDFFAYIMVQCSWFQSLHHLTQRTYQRLLARKVYKQICEHYTSEKYAVSSQNHKNIYGCLYIRILVQSSSVVLK